MTRFPLRRCDAEDCNRPFMTLPTAVESFGVPMARFGRPGAIQTF